MCLLVIFSSIPFFLFPANSISASDKKRPDWLSDKLPVPSNETFYYQISSAKAHNLESARNEAFTDLINYIDQQNNVKISGEISVVSSSDQQNSVVNEAIEKQYSYKYKIDSDEISIIFRKIDEYWELETGNNGEPMYRYYSLYAIARKHENVSFDEVRFTYKYGFDALWRSVLVPGYGQIYKGSTAKGVSILGGEVALISGIILTENTRSSYRRKAKETYDVSKIRSYTDKADNYETARNICIGGAVALYIYNVIDAVASNGRKRTITKRRLNLNPAFSRGQSGVSLSYTF